MPQRKRGDHSTVIDKKLIRWLRSFGGVSAGVIEVTTNKTRQARLEIHLERSPIEIIVRHTGKIQQLYFYLPSKNSKAAEPNFREDNFWKKRVFANWILKKYQVVRYEFDTDGKAVIKTEVNSETEVSDESSTD